MALRNARFVHVQTPGGHSNGFSVYFWPDGDEYGGTEVDPVMIITKHADPSVVHYSVAVCNKADHFCKRLAREQCFRTEGKTCKISEFPSILAALECKAWGISYDKQEMLVKRFYANKYAWLFKYFL